MLRSQEQINKLFHQEAKNPTRKDAVTGQKREKSKSRKDLNLAKRKTTAGKPIHQSQCCSEEKPKKTAAPDDSALDIKKLKDKKPYGSAQKPQLRSSLVVKPSSSKAVRKVRFADQCEVETEITSSS